MNCANPNLRTRRASSISRARLSSVEQQNSMPVPKPRRLPRRRRRRARAGPEYTQSRGSPAPAALLLVLMPAQLIHSRPGTRRCLCPTRRSRAPRLGRSRRRRLGGLLVVRRGRSARAPRVSINMVRCCTACARRLPDRSNRRAAALRGLLAVRALYTRAEHECASHERRQQVLLQGMLVAVIRGELTLRALVL